MYEMIKERMSTGVPFAKHAGVEIAELADGTATARLAQTDVTINHIGSQHAGALFTLGEAASGAAMAGAFAKVLLSVRPLAGAASINYKKVAKGTVTANAKTGRPPAELLEELETEGKVRFPIEVDLQDKSDQTVAVMVVEWSVAKQ